MRRFAKLFLVGRQARGGRLGGMPAAARDGRFANPFWLAGRRAGVYFLGGRALKKEGVERARAAMPAADKEAQEWILGGERGRAAAFP